MMQADIEDFERELELGHEKNSSVIGILDMDAFEVQIYLKKTEGRNWKHLYETKPHVLADSTTDRIVSVNYPSRDFNISRDDTVTSALAKCPRLKVMRKDVTYYNKSESSSLRHSSQSVLDCIVNYREKYQCKIIIDYASNDEFYLDLTEEINHRMKNFSAFPITLENLGSNTHLEGGSSKSTTKAIEFRSRTIYPRNIPKYWGEARLVVGAVLLEDIRRSILNKTQFEASGGVACNKLLAKLACPFHKPGGMTILPEVGLHRISGRIPIEKLPTLGGGRGKMLQDKLHSGRRQMTMKDLAKFTIPQLKRRTGMESLTAMNVFKLANGISNDKVVEKLMKTSVSVSISNLRKFGLFFSKVDDVQKILNDLCEEMKERLIEEKERNHRGTESLRFEFSGFSKGHKGRNPATKGFTLQVSRDPERIDVSSVVSEAMVEYRKVFNNVTGMHVKVSILVKNFVPL